MRPAPSRARRAAQFSGVAAIAAALVLATPLAASAAEDDDVSAPGGATRVTDDRTQSIRDSLVDGPAKNVILLIGDGMGDSEITVARNYEYGAAGTLPGIDALPLTGSYTTWSLQQGTDHVNYVPDSAATGTAWATGTKSYNGAIGVDTHGDAQSTLIELAKANGLRTGNVTTSEIQDATPAVQVAHVADRGCYGPDDVEDCGDDALALGGPGSISEQLLDTRADVTFGGGAASFEQTALAGDWAGDTLWQQAEARGYQTVTDVAGMQALTGASQHEPVLGLFTDGNFPTHYAPSEATIGGGDLPAQPCVPNDERLDPGLSLASMTDTAIDLLDTEDSDGFFLQVEGASIDKRDHAADACGQIGETVDLDEAVQAALEFAEQDGDTMVIVTADHAHTSQIVGSTTPGLSVALETLEGEQMIVAYGTAEAGGSQQHTGAQVRIAGYGPGAANIVGLSDQTDTFFTIAQALQLNRDLAALSAGAAVSVPADALAPGGSFSATASGFAGDKRVHVYAGDDLVETLDVIDGGATAELAASSTEGESGVRFVGAQTGVAASGTVTVAAGGDASASPSPAPSASAPAGATGAGSNGSLPFTGAEALPLLLAGLMLLATGAVIAVSRARRRRAGLQL